MSKSVTYWLVAVTFLFSLLHLSNGLLSLDDYECLVTPLIACGLYLAAIVLSLLPYKNFVLPAWVGIFNFLVSVALPILVLSQFPFAIADSSGSFDTWFVGGISTLLAINTIRGHAKLSWAALAILWIQMIVWGGAGTIATTGLIGALVYVAASDGLGRGLRAAMRQTSDNLQKALQISTSTARKTVARNERNQLVQSALLAGLPLLEGIAESQGQITPQLRKEILLSEARFRDEVQGRTMLDDGVRLAAREARKRSVTVNFLDEGGLDGADADTLESIRQSIVGAIEATQSGQITIKAPSAESYLVSIVATRPEAAGPDLWMRLP